MQMGELKKNTDSGDLLLNAIKKFAMAPEEILRVVSVMKANVKNAHPSYSEKQIQKVVARSLVDKYCWFATVSGGATGLVGIIPGPHAVALAIGGASTDVAVTMKLQVDMCMCLAAAYGYDVTSVDAQNLALLIASGASLEGIGAETAIKIGSKAGVKMIHQYLKGAVLQTIKEFFKKIGITFTKKALEKMIPFGVGVVVGAGANYFLTKYVGKQALKWFDEDLKVRESEAAQEV